ncbi:uncharacterized protein LOC133193317 isoform X2 [Saccostrea echinata]|uniref:uncharacterized protein LOC133193317 isoform X2 n=1 Tax=Saccostrea echinata TaxID=191078 RepID=UPI002A839E26|nr:uncharacterized protein LOC133193317 isoform X2 [Saccostrea echinata]
MTNLEIFLILALVCFICGGSQGLRSRSKAVQLKQKIRRCSDTVTIHRRDENSNEKQFHKGIQCESDEDCKESDPCQSGKCCEIPCEHLSEYYHVVDKMCRYPIDNQNLLNSFSPERNRTL